MDLLICSDFFHLVDEESNYLFFDDILNELPKVPSYTDILLARAGMIIEVVNKLNTEERYNLENFAKFVYKDSTYRQFLRDESKISYRLLAEGRTDGRGILAVDLTLIVKDAESIEMGWRVRSLQACATELRALEEFMSINGLSTIRLPAIDFRSLIQPSGMNISSSHL